MLGAALNGDSDDDSVVLWRIANLFFILVFYAGE